jgi:hypothetical protein
VRAFMAPSCPPHVAHCKRPASLVTRLMTTETTTGAKSFVRSMERSAASAASAAASLEGSSVNLGSLVADDTAIVELRGINGGPSRRMPAAPT